MLRNHIKFALRVLWKDGIYSILNLSGLTLGITVGIILLLFLQNELNYDLHHEKKDQIFRFTNHLKAQGADFNTARTPRELAPRLLEEIPDLINYVRIDTYRSILIATEIEGSAPVKFYEEEVVIADSTLFSVFSHEVLEGDPVNCLNGPDKAVLTKTMAKKYFGEKSAIGKTLFVDEEGDARIVTAVIADLPDNSHLKFDIILSDLPTRGDFDEENPMRDSERYWNPGIYTYLMFPENYDVNKFYNHFDQIFEKYYRPFADRIDGSSKPLLTPLADIHFSPEIENDEVHGNINYVYTFSAIGLFLILLACINYMNLATARSVYRAGEIGVRKVLGKTRTDLFWSILLEAIVLSFVAMILSMVFAYVVLYLTPFNSWIDKNLTLDFFQNGTLLIGALGIAIIVGLISGIYPAVYIPSVSVVEALKGSFSNQGRGILLRKVLITLQFVVSIFVIITTVLMDEQINYMKKVDLGFNIENLLLVGINNEEVVKKIPAVKAELLANPNVIETTTAYGIPGYELGGQVFMVEQDGAEMAQKSMFTIYSGEGYIDAMHYEIVEGRDFLPNMAEVRKSILVNEAGAKELGWGDHVINRKVKFFHGENEMRVVGMIKDFNFQSLHKNVEPMFILPSDDHGGALHVRMKNNDLQGTIAHVRKVMEKFDQKNPFEYTFMDQEFNEQYKADQIQHQLISTLSYICIFISLLGLVGLSAFTVSQKAKEISIRKTLGASMPHILLLISKGYVKLIIIATLIAIPLADFIMVDWLSAFAYQMPKNWFYYLIPSFLVIILGLSTVLVQVFKVAKSNPVEGLKSE